MRLALSVALLLVAPRVSAQDAPPMEDFADSQSIGDSDSGRLEHAFELESTDDLVAQHANRFGTRELVGLLRRTANAVARMAPGSRLLVGDLSSENGGPLAPHRSHQSGRDADVGLFLVDASGQPIPQGQFYALDANGTVRRGDATYTFDDARNWALLVALVDDPAAEVQHVLIIDALRDRLLAYAHATEQPADELRRVELVTQHVSGSEHHDDHFHVRIYCAVGDRPLCLDRPPLFPWYEGTPSPDAVEAVRAADLLRAAELRREQQLQRRAEDALRHAADVQAQHEASRAHDLALEPARQSAAEQRRAVQLSADERRALSELARMEAQQRREQQQQLTAEAGRASALSRDDAHWADAERRRAEHLRAETRAREASMRRAAERQARLAAQAERVAEQQRLAGVRRAALLERRAEQLRQRQYRHPRAAD